MTEYSLVIAGLPVPFFDRLRKEAENRIAPGGKLFVTPTAWSNGYDPKHADHLLKQVYEHCLGKPEKDPVVTLLLYVDYGDKSTASLLEKFFPFALPRRLVLPDLEAARNKPERNKLLNDFAIEIIQASRSVRATSNVISHRTNVRNLNPLLLPVRNFGSDNLTQLLRKIYGEAAHSEDPDKLVGEEIDRFLSKHPWATPPDAKKHALSDGVLYFKSPGNDRHGYLRNSVAKSHPIDCLLNARSRLGGAYDYCLHYDCTPVKGKLKSAYENCHGHDSPPKKTHVNIAPNDFII